MTTRSKFVSFALCFLSTSAHAETYYDILKNQFNSSRTAPEINEFDRVGYPLAKICLEVKSANPDSDHLVRIFRFTEIKDGRGPLLPEKRFEKIVFTEYNAPDIRYVIDLVKTTITKKEIISLQQNGPKDSITLKVRKYDNYLVFERTASQIFNDKTTKIVSYGYCYQR
ncbi:MAG: hypothetical protein A2Z20_12690 [Bdellovibrionales bacterium RBG_16_40_8]|nr:MAG: hypothetical protein A2Z20_12690 [Bdellovibrionales bacterium RBG_16_40_8]